ncbi:hypothetical protein ACLBWT_19845 [Paenibacillus sp. D51F]
MNQDTPAVYSRMEAAVPRRTARRSPVPFLIAWLLITAAGIAGAWFYTQHLQQQMSLQIQQQTDMQIAELQARYDEKLDMLESGYQTELAALNSKVQSLNELLAFTRDNASGKTDNSNKLFTQLSEVQKQLDELKKNLDVLK